MKIIFNNALPFSGKDTFTKKLVESKPDHVWVRFKDPLYKGLAKRHNLTMEQVLSICEGPVKDQPSELLGGLVPRQELIDISENHIKVAYGETGVARLVIEDILDTEDYNQKTFVFSDGGFQAEIDFMNRVLKRYGLTEITVVRINRPGITENTVGDSRELVKDVDLYIENDIEESGEEMGSHMLAQYEAYLKNK